MKSNSRVTLILGSVHPLSNQRARRGARLNGNVTYSKPRREPIRLTLDTVFNGALILFAAVFFAGGAAQGLIRSGLEFAAGQKTHVEHIASAGLELRRGVQPQAKRQA